MKPKSIFQDLSAYAIGSVVITIIGLLKYRYYTDFFSPETFGHYALVTTTFQFLNILLFQWVSSCVWRFYRNDTASKTELKRTITLLFICGCVITLVFTLAWLILLNPLYRWLVLLNGLSIALSQLFGISSVITRIEKHSTTFNLLRAIQAIGAFGTTLLFVVYFDVSIEAIYLGNCIFWILSYIALLIAQPSNNFLVVDFFKAAKLKEILTFGFVSVSTELLFVVLNSSDRYIIDYYHSENALGIYFQVYSLAQLGMMTFAGVIIDPITPDYFKKLAEMKGKQFDATNANMFYLFLMLPLCLLIPLVDKHVITLLFNDRFHSGAIYLTPICISFFIYFFTHFKQLYAQQLKRYKMIVVIFIAGAFLNLLLNFILIPRIGVIGAVYATISTYAAILVLFSLNTKGFKVRPRKEHYSGFYVLVSVFGITYLLYFLNPFQHYDLLFDGTLALVSSVIFYGFLYKNRTSLLKSS